MKYRKIKCKICNNEIFTNIFSQHIKKKHKSQSKEYYDKYIRKINDGICLTCKKETDFKGITKGYYTFCSVKCSVNNENIKKKKKETMIKLYGVENPSQSEIVKGKKKETLKKHYGEDNYFKTKEYKDKLQKIGKEKYNIDNMINTSQIPLSREKAKKTNLEKYGHICNLHSELGKQKTKETNIKKYGVENVFQSEEIKQKIKQTNLKKYGYEYNLQIPEIRQQIEQTNLEKYGEKYYSCTEEFKKYISELMSSEEMIQRVKQTNVERHGVENPNILPEIQVKMNETKRKNKTFNTSSKEELTYSELVDLYGENNVIRQYRSELYPFNCDFYIKTKNLYIECNYHWTHHDHFFDENNEEDKNLLNKWKEKSKTSKYYKNAISTWTNLDKKKQKCFIENNLNYLVFWSYKEFEEWFNERKKSL